MKNIYPINFSIPFEKITNINEDMSKNRLVSTLIPGQLNTYIYKTEREYYKQYSESMFAITSKKGGWDCLRHYEILACGTIPLFGDLNKCPKTIMTMLPKDLIYKGDDLYNKIKIHGTTNELLVEYKLLRTKLMEYTINNLTTTSIAKYVCDVVGLNYNNESNNILFLSGNASPDYLRCLTLHGFKHLFGTRCHDYPKITHLYKHENINYTNLYGKGFTYTNLLEQNKRETQNDENIINNLTNNKYDFIIYGSCHRGMPYYDLVKNHYEPGKIILLCGEDLDEGKNVHECKFAEYSNKGHFIFIRELNCDF
jgi:hypothetical protein